MYWIILAICFAWYGLGLLLGFGSGGAVAFCLPMTPFTLLAWDWLHQKIRYDL